jgi:hypothetical protein
MPAWVVMWVLAGGIYALCKALTWVRTSVPGSTRTRQLGYLLAWPGMDAKAFLDPKPLAAEKRPNVAEWTFAAVKLLVGSALVWVVLPSVPADLPLLRGWVGMIGLVFFLHFGTFHLLSCAWRAGGVDAKPLMNRPIVSSSLSEFWGRRWNTAFRDLTHRFLFRPLASRFGPRGGLAVGFLASGLVHDFVISVPADGGYGLPTLYFVVQGVGLLAERSGVGKSLGLGLGWKGWAFTAVILSTPAGLLFHPPFVLRVVNPFLDTIGATSWTSPI